MVSYFKPYLIQAYNKDKKVTKPPVDKDVYLRWKKRGADPEKFRKLFPDCSTSNFDKDIDPQFGKVMIDYILSSCEKIIENRT